MRQVSDYDWLRGRLRRFAGIYATNFTQAKMKEQYSLYAELMQEVGKSTLAKAMDRCERLRVGTEGKSAWFPLVSEIRGYFPELAVAETESETCQMCHDTSGFLRAKEEQNGRMYWVARRCKHERT